MAKKNLTEYYLGTENSKRRKFKKLKEELMTIVFCKNQKSLYWVM